MKISKFKLNGKNPRTIKDGKFEKLCKSIEDFPKMMELRPIIVDGSGLILGGNMRFSALKHLGYKEIPDSWVKLADTLTEAEKQEFIVKDNVGFGDWDFEELDENWQADDLEKWGLDVPDWGTGETDYSDKNQEIDTESFSDKMTLKLELSEDEYAFVTDKLSRKDANKENALLKILGYGS